MIERYSLKRMSSIFEEESKFNKMLGIELLTCEAYGKLGKIPMKDVNIIKKRAKFNLRNIKKIEEKSQHDIVAFVTDVSRNLGDKARYIHKGLTSSDLLDTTLSLQLIEASNILIQDLKELLSILAKKTRQYKDMVCIGRSHGVHAEPMTLGLKFALWHEETKRNIERLIQAKRIISVGKISGPIGTYSNVEPFIENYVCRKLKILPANVSTQIIQRDRYAQFLSTLAIIGASLEKFATEIRHLQRTEVRELEEPFLEGQKGSSAMPHKRNPVICERICGLSRILRANSLVSMENIALWHERDISHSSAERIIIPDSCILLDYMLERFIFVMNGLLVYPSNMMENLVKTKGLIFSGRVLEMLMKKGLNRTKAYSIVQQNAMKVWQKNISFQDLLKEDKIVNKYLSSKELDSCFYLDYYLRNINKIFKRIGL